MNGGAFKVDAEVEVISNKEVYLRLDRPVEPGARILIITRFAKDWAAGFRAPTVALRGKVSRLESRPGREDEVVVAVTRFRFL